MPQFKPKFRPGINKLDTALASEGGYADGNLIRSYQGKWQPVGGWNLVASTPVTGISRSAHGWPNKDGTPFLATGTEQGLYAYVGGSVVDITPQLHDTVLEDNFSTVNTSTTVTVEVAYHNLSAGDSVIFSNHQSTVGGLTIEGTYTIDATPTVNTFTITHGSAATSTVDDGGGFVDFKAALPDGFVDTPPTGYGTGTYDTGTYSVGTSSGNDELRTWALDNSGENLLANPSGYGLFEWQPEIAYNDLASNGDFASDATGWALGTGWAWGSGKVTKTAGTGSNLSQSVLDIAEGGRYYRVTFTVTDQTAGVLKFRVNAGDTPAVVDVGEASSDISKNGTYSRLFLCPAVPSDFLFEADASFDGSVDDVVYQIEDKAYRIDEAPWRMDYMYVNTNGVVVAVGASDADGAYVANCVRNSGIGNVRDWTPDSASASAINYLRGGGGRLMTGLATRQQDLIWADNGVFSLQWNASDPLNGKAFKINQLGTGCGAISRNSAAEHNGFVMWASREKFFIFRGIGATSLGKPEEIKSPLQSYVFDSIDENQILKCCAGVSPEFSEFWFFYPDTDDKASGSEAENSKAVSISWTDESLPWSPHEIVRTAWSTSGAFTKPIGIGVYGANSLIYEHESGTKANGASLGWYIESGYFDVQEGDYIAYINEMRPDFADMSGTVQVTLSARNYSGGATVSTASFDVTSTTQKVDTRLTGRQLKIKYEEKTAGAFAREGAISFNMQQTGAMR